MGTEVDKHVHCPRAQAVPEVHQVKQQPPPPPLRPTIAALSRHAQPAPDLPPTHTPVRPHATHIHIVPHMPMPRTPRSHECSGPTERNLASKRRRRRSGSGCRRSHRRRHRGDSGAYQHLVGRRGGSMDDRAGEARSSAECLRPGGIGVGRGGVPSPEDGFGRDCGPVGTWAGVGQARSRRLSFPLSSSDRTYAGAELERRGRAGRRGGGGGGQREFGQMPSHHTTHRRQERKHLRQGR
jgi:hypothetical protein